MADSKISALPAVVTPLGTDELAVNQGGTSKKITVTQIVSLASSAVPDPLLLGDGSAAAPTYSFTSDPDTGVYSHSANSLGFSTAGVGRFQISSNAFRGQDTNAAAILNEIPSTINPTLVPNQSDPDTGIGRSGTDSLSLITGGREAIRIANVGADIQRRGRVATVAASATQAQGNGTINNNIITNVGTVATTDDVITLSPASDGVWVHIINTGANRLQIFPSTGDAILPNAVNASITLDAGSGLILVAEDTTNWVLLGKTDQGVSFPLLATDGSVAAPSYSFSADPDTGWFRSGSGEVRFSSNNNQVWEINATAIEAIDVAAGPSIRNVNSTATVPGLLPVLNDTDTGIGRNLSNELSLIAGGVEVLRADGAGVTAQVQTVAGTATLPSYSFIGDEDTGAYSKAANELGFAVGGADVVNITSAGLNANQGAGPALLNEDASSTNPTLVPNQADPDTGLGRDAVDGLALIAGGVDCLRVREIGGARAVGFYTTTPIVQQTGVAVTAAGIHAACVALGLFTA